MTVLLRQSTAITLRFGPFVDSTDGITPETALTIAQADRKFSKNGGAFAQTSDTSNATHDTGGFYSASFTATDTDTVGSLRLSVQKTGAAPFFETFNVLPAAVFDAHQSGINVLGSLAYGTAQSGASLAIALATSASASDDYYNGALVVIIAGTGAGQARYIEDYVGSTRSCTVDHAWVTTPDSTSKYVVLPSPVIAKVSDVTTALGGRQITGSLNTDGVRPTYDQALLFVHQALQEVVISGNNLLVKDVDGATTLRTLALSPDATTPTSRTVTA